ncbi:LuxR C-terminal-related transcriptional regulator [Demequina aurantiaca]|uniref:helix-turn-helix transcriptional regulator n=1 Tax=Demequina aurantiaca TaxID=676200 RepID=UPI003D33F058
MPASVDRSALRLDRHPRVPTLSLRRPAVSALLDSGTRLAVVCAPAGYGKATVVAQWLAAEPARRERSAWLSLSGLDDDAVRSVLAELAVDPRVAALETVVIEGARPLEGLPLHASVRQLLEALNCRVVLITSDPRAIPEYMAAALDGLLVDSEQLAMGREEVEGLVALRGVRSREVEPIDVHRLALGWPLAAAMLISVDARDRDSLVDALDAYLDNEVLTGLEPWIREVLEATAASTWVDRGVLGLLSAGESGFLEIVDAAVGAQIATVRGAGADARLVLVPAVRARLLRRRMQQDSEALAVEHARLVEWLDVDAVPDIALYHAVEAQNWDLAVEVFERHWSELYISHNTTATWALSALPASLRESRLGLQAGLEVAISAESLGGHDRSWHTQGLVPAHPAMHGLEGAETSRPAQSSRDVTTFDLWRMVRARRGGDFAEAVSIADAMRARWLSGGAVISKLKDFGPGLFLQWGITAQLAGDDVRARADFEISYELGPASRVDFVPRNAVGCLALMDALDGDVPGARAWLERGKDLRKPRGRWTRIAMVAENVAAALVEVLEGHPDIARQHLIDPSKVADQDEYWAVTLYARVLVAQASGSALSMLDEVVRQQKSHSSTTREPGMASLFSGLAEAEVRLTLGQPGHAATVLERLPPQPTVRVMRAHAQYALGDVTAALDQAVGAKWASHVGPGARAHASVLHLMCCAMLDEHGGAADAGARTEELIESYRLERAWSLIDDAARSAVTQGGGEVEWELLPVAVYPPPSMLESLTPRELAALRAVADGASVEAAAHALFVSANTVRSQLKAVYRKLGVSSRSEAIAAAARRGLLS